MAADAYYPTHESNPYKFTEAQLTPIKGFTQSHLICAVTSVESIQKNAFYVQTDENPRVSCKEYTAFDFAAFADKSSSKSRKKLFRQFKPFYGPFYRPEYY